MENKIKNRKDINIIKRKPGKLMHELEFEESTH